MNTRLSQDFFNRNTLEVARSLLGKVLCVKHGSNVLMGIITETEAYCGFDDDASHAFRGKTFRNSVMFGKAGFTYVYFTYGMHHMLNIVTEEEGFPGAVLIRSLDVSFSRFAESSAEDARNVLDIMSENRYGKMFDELSFRQRNGLTNGPAKLTQALNIKRETHNKLPVFASDLVWLQEERGIAIPKFAVTRTSRVGIGYAKKSKEWPWRFILTDQSKKKSVTHEMKGLLSSPHEPRYRREIDHTVRVNLGLFLSTSNGIVYLFYYRSQELKCG